MDSAKLLQLLPDHDTELKFGIQTGAKEALKVSVFIVAE